MTVALRASTEVDAPGPLPKVREEVDRLAGSEVAVDRAFSFDRERELVRRRSEATVEHDGAALDDLVGGEWGDGRGAE